MTIKNWLEIKCVNFKNQLIATYIMEKKYRKIF